MWVVVVVGLTSLRVVVVTLTWVALGSSCRTSTSALLTVGVGLDQHVALVSLKRLYKFSEMASLHLILFILNIILLDWTLDGPILLI